MLISVDGEKVMEILSAEYCFSFQRVSFFFEAIKKYIYIFFSFSIDPYVNLMTSFHSHKTQLFSNQKA